MNTPDPHQTDDAFHQLIHSNHMYGLWEIASQMTPQPQPEAVAHIWKWPLIEEIVRQSCTAVPVGDERRAMQLFNPGLNGQWATTNTLIAAVQVLMPGEIARAHRHSPSAIRFVMQGDGAFVVCFEEVAGAFLIATNYFRREADGWKMTHHQAGPVPAPEGADETVDRPIH
jgi:gentisate 1,2-dioxygenase